MLKILVYLSLLSLALTGCSQASNKNVELTISAAASLTDSMKEVQALYEKEHPNVKLMFNFGASGTLQQQIEQGAPADLFLSAGKKQMTALIDKKLIESSDQKNLLTNELVAVVPKDAKLQVTKIEDVTKSEIKKLAVGEPETVPAGMYTKDSLTYFKIWDAALPIIVYAKDVKQVLNYVETGNTEVGFVYKTDALTSPKVTVAFAVDSKSYTPIEYPIGIVKATKHRKEAETLFNYLQSKPAQEIFLKYGFSLPKS